MDPIFEIFKGKRKQWYFRLRAGNGKIILQSEGYVQKRNAYKGIQSIYNCVEVAGIVEV